MVRAGDLIKVGSGVQVLNKVAVFAGIDPDLRRNAISLWNERYPETPWTMEWFAPGWGDEAVLRWEVLTEEQWVRSEILFGKQRAVIVEWLKEGRKALKEQLHAIRKQVSKIEDAISHGPEQQGKFMRFLMISLRKYDALQWLAENLLLPRFGFPISSVSLSPPKKLESAGPIDRDRRQAIMEWTPGANVVVANNRWIVRGLAADTRRGQSENHHRLFTLLQCPDCKHQHVSRSTDLGVCPACSSSKRVLRPIVIPFAFAAQDEYKLAGADSELPMGRSSRILTLDDREWPEGHVTFRSSVHVAFLNLGKEENGYWLCSGCGSLRGARPGARAWMPCPCSKDTNTEPEPIVLGEVVRMDVLRIRPSSLVTYEGMRALSQALRLAAAFLLELDPRSLALADIPEDDVNTLFLVDLTDGGSGLLARLQEEERCAAWLTLARRILTHEHRPAEACVNACPECLLTHANRAEHRNRPFRRAEGLLALDQFYSDLKEMPKPKEQGSPGGEPKAWSWEDVQHFSSMDVSIIQAFKSSGLPIPEVGVDLVQGQEVVGNAELCWVNAQVAVMDRGEAIPAMPHWALLSASDPALLEKVVHALTVSAT
jgi:hypothetical protein